MPGNPSYDGAIAFAAEKQIKRTWTQVWSTMWPLLQMIKAKKLNFNTMGKSASGNSMLIPINYAGPTTTARAGTATNAFTPIAPTPTVGFTQAQYFYARYENAFWLTSGERKLLTGPESRAPIMPGKIDQLMTDFKKQVTSDLLGTQNGTGTEGAGNGKLTGEQYFLSQSNSPGGIPQGTYPVWQAGVVTGAGAFYNGLIDAEIDRIHDLDRGDADFCQLSYTATNNVYGKLRDTIAPAQLIVDPVKEATYGFKTFRYMELDCFQDGRLGTALPGSMVVGRSGAWYVNMDTEMPVPSPVDGKLRLDGTTSSEHMYEWWMSWGTDDPASNTLVTGIL